MAKVFAPDDKSWVVALERGVTAGEEIDVDVDVAAGLTDQGWTTRKTKTAPVTDDAPTVAPDEQE